MHPLRRHVVQTALALVACLATPCLQAQVATPLRAARIAGTYTRPVYVTTPPGDESRLFVVEQWTGLIRVVKNGTVLTAPFINLLSKIFPNSSERGLLGLAFHPRYSTNGLFFVYYTRVGDGSIVVERYRVSATNPDVADATSNLPILTIAHPVSNHNGGCLQFGPDGYLYIGTGDGGSAGDPPCNGQNRQAVLGKILRIDIDNGTPYAIPPTNPFAGNTAYREEIWALGMRNPWRFAFDRLTGDVWYGDVGQNVIEEIDFEPANTGGRNYGWRMMEGNSCYSATLCFNYNPPCNSPLFTAPVWTYTHGSDCSVTGGYVYRGCAIPDLRGTYFFADYCSGNIWSFRYAGGSVTQFANRRAELFAATVPSVVSFGEDARGEMYICDLNGGVYKIVPNGNFTPAVDLGNALAGSAGTPAFDACGILASGKSADFRLRNAPPRTPVVLVLGRANTPTPIFDGTLVPSPNVPIAFETAADGTLLLPAYPGGGGPATFFAQFLVYDPFTGGPPQQFSFSNALQINLLP